MIIASEIKTGIAIKINDEVYKVIDVEHKTGTAKMASIIHIKILNLKTRTFKDMRLHPKDKIEDVELKKKMMQYLYTDGENLYLMNPTNYEQIQLPKTAVEVRKEFIQEGMNLEVEFYEGNPVSINFPSNVELKVISTAPPLKTEGTDGTYKPAVLENGLELLVPQFIKEGDVVVVDVSSAKYQERVRR